MYAPPCHVYYNRLPKKNRSRIETILHIVLVFIRSRLCPERSERKLRS